MPFAVSLCDESYVTILLMLIAHFAGFMLLNCAAPSTLIVFGVFLLPISAITL